MASPFFCRGYYWLELKIAQRRSQNLVLSIPSNCHGHLSTFMLLRRPAAFQRWLDRYVVPTYRCLMIKCSVFCSHDVVSAHVFRWSQVRMTNFATFLDHGSSGRRAMVSCAMIVHILCPKCCFLCMTQGVRWSLARKRWAWRSGQGINDPGV